MFIITTDIMLQHCMDFTKDPTLRHLQLSKSAIAQVANLIISPDGQPNQTLVDFKRTTENFARDFFNICKNITNPEYEEVKESDYPQFIKEIQNMLMEHFLNQLKVIFGLNGKVFTINKNKDKLRRAFKNLVVLDNQDTGSKYAQPFEAFLSDKVFPKEVWANTTTLILPKLLEILIKYSAKSFYYAFEHLVELFSASFGMQLSDCIVELDRFRQLRLKGQSYTGTYTFVESAEPEEPKDPTKLIKLTELTPSPTSKDTGKSQTAATVPTATTTAAKDTMAATDTTATKASVAATTTATKDLDHPASLLSRTERHDLLAALQAQNPHPQSELNYRNNFELLCAVVLSAQATDKSVNLATPKLFAAAPTPQAMMALGAEGIAPYIQSIGLWRIKAERLALIAQILHEKYHDEVPNDYGALLKLPGVGTKTAKVVLNVAFGQPHIAVDTHVFRVCNRTGLCLGNSPEQVEKNLPDLVEPQFAQDAHHYLLLHGRYVCTAQNFEQRCATCVAAKWCKYHEKHQQEI